MLSDCSLLISLTNISKWDTNNASDMSYLFEDVYLYCLYLILKSGILLKFIGLFMNCISINSFPDITQWMIKAFSKCYIFDNYINSINKNNFGN